MWTYVDRICIALLVIGVFGHTMGSFKVFGNEPEHLVWAISGTCLLALTAMVNILRASRPNDRPLAWIAVAGTVFWMGLTVWFGLIIGNLIDPRIAVFLIACGGLIVSGVRIGLGGGATVRTPEAE